MKKWIFNTFFKKERIVIFRDAQKDILETMTDDLEKRAEVLAEEKIKTLFSLADMEEVLEIKLKKVLIGGKEAPDARISNLKAEADFFLASDLWKVMNETLKEDAQRAMFVLGEDASRQLATGRTILYTLSIQQKIVKLLSTFTGTSS